MHVSQSNKTLFRGPRTAKPSDLDTPTENHCRMEKGPPAIVIVPGFWCSATGVYDQLTTRLQERGLEVVVAEYRSTGHGSSDGITLYDDVDAVRGYIEPLVSMGREVIVGAHSAGGYVPQ